MRKLWLGVFGLLLALAMPVSANAYPAQIAWVNDFAHILSEDQRIALNNELVQFKDDTTIEIAVVTVDNLNGEDDEAYAANIGNQWGVGNNGRSNGIVLLISLEEHAVRIKTIRNAEGALQDDAAASIVNDTIIPAFRNDNGAQGIIDGTHEIMRQARIAATDSDSGDTSGQSADTQIAAVPDYTVDRYQPVQPEEHHFVWSDYDTKLVKGIAGIVFIVGLLFAFARRPYKRWSGRRYVRDHKADVAAALAKAVKTAQNADVAEKSRTELNAIKSDFNAIDVLHEDSELVEWDVTGDKLRSISSDLEELEETMENDVSFAAHAREEGPKLMAELPGTFDKLEAKLAKGKQSSEAKEQLAAARAKYDEARTQQQGMSTTNWILLYMLLHQSHESCHSAENYYHDANTYHAPVTPMSTLPSYGFSNHSSFSGGGGFSMGGGGAGGRW